MKSKRVNLLYKLFSQDNPSQAISKSRLVSEIPEISRNNQSCNAEFDLVDSSSGSTRHFHIHVSSTNIIHTTRVETLGTFRLDYEYEIEYEYDFSILVFRLHIITTHTHLIPWATLST